MPHNRLLAVILVGSVLIPSGTAMAASLGSAASSKYSTHTVPLKKCRAGGSQSQVEMNTCADEEAAAEESSLSKALATESTYWGTNSVESSQTPWLTYVSVECAAESQVNLGGTIYPLEFSSCVLTLTRERLQLVRSITLTLSKQEKKHFAAGTFPVAIKIPTGSSTSVPTTTTPTPSTSGGATDVLPIAVSGALSVPALPQPPGVIEPSSCTVNDDLATAKGTVNEADLDESLVRAGDEIELYIFSGAAPNNPIQLGTLTQESPAQLAPNWTVTVPLAPTFAAQLGSGSYCDVALQATHAFMYAGSAGS
jgi:uncharacterized protein YecT (DUF1311 family)